MTAGDVEMLKELERIVERVEFAETLAPHGSHEQGEYVKAALYSEWARLRAIVEVELKIRDAALAGS
jgi:hypothetical protein